MNPNHPRRVFMLCAIAGGTALAAGHALAQDAPAAKGPKPRLTETDGYAKSMGFKLDTKQVDKAKYPRHDAATQSCAKCQLYSGKDGDEVGPCSFFGGRLVSPNGWCRNFKVRKAAA